MKQLELLWEYQLADVEVDNLELSIRRSPKRQKLVRLRDSYQELQKGLKDIEDEVLAMLDRLDVVKDAIALTEDQLRQLQAKVQEEPAQDSEGIRLFLEEAQRLTTNLVDFDTETRRIRQSAADREARQRDFKLRLIAAKEEFVPLRDEYDSEYKQSMAEVEKLREAAKAKQEGIEPAYLEKYNAIKQHAVPPLARLVNDQCSGCNMAFPSSVLHSIRSGKLVECETCGRMVIE